MPRSHTAQRRKEKRRQLALRRKRDAALQRRWARRKPGH